MNDTLIKKDVKKSKIRFKLTKPEYLTWENIQNLYPDKFVLLENPEYKGTSPIVKGGIVRYKNRSKDRVVEVANQLTLNHLTVKYTGGKLDKTDFNFILSIIIATLFFTIPFRLFSQEDHVNKSVHVIREYNPTVSDAFKINDMPSASDTLKANPVFRYQITGKPLVTPPEMVPLTPARLAKEPLEELFPAYIQGYGGIFNPKMGGIFGGQLLYNLIRNEKFAVALNASHETSFGKIKLYDEDGNFAKETDAGYHDTKAGLHTRHFFKRSTLSTNMDYNNLFYRYYGLNGLDGLEGLDGLYGLNGWDGLDGLKTQRQMVFDMNARLNNRVLNNETQYDVLLGFYTFGNKTGVTENSFRYGGDFDFSIADFYIRLETAVDFAATNIDDVQQNNPSIYNFDNRNRTLIQANPAILKRHNNFLIKIGMKFGIDYDDLYDLEEDYSETLYISPDVSVNFTIENRIMLQVGMTGDVKPNSYRSVMAENPFVSPDLNMRTAFHQAKFFAGIKGNFNNKTSFGARVEYGNFFNEHFFVNKFYQMLDANDGTIYHYYSNQFGVHYDDGRLLTVSGEFNTNIIENFDIALRAAYFGWNTETEEKAWHKPNMELGIRANYTATRDLQFIAAFNVLGGREALMPDDSYKIYQSIAPQSQTNTIKLKTVFDFNLGANYTLNSRWHFFATAQNIFVSKYYLYYGYPTYGINMRVGAGYSF